MFVTFAAFGHVGHIVEQFEKVQDGFVNATCLPLYSILLALDNPIVDYFSLDIEGNELEVLKTIPFDKVDIKVRTYRVLTYKNGPFEMFIKNLLSSVSLQWSMICYQNVFVPIYISVNTYKYISQELTNFT